MREVSASSMQHIALPVLECRFAPIISSNILLTSYLVSQLAVSTTGSGRTSFLGAETMPFAKQLSFWTAAPKPTN
jgi:hypothetical protein